MTRTLIVSGSPAPAPRCLLVCRHLRACLGDAGVDAEVLDVREIPAEELLRWRRGHSPSIRAAAGKIGAADAVVLVTPVYHAAYSGALKAFLDVLPRRAFADKIVFPVCIAGSLAHRLAVDYALRPVLASMGCPHVLKGVFLLDASIPRNLDGATGFDDQTARRVGTGLEELARALAYPAATLVDRDSAVARSVQ